MQRRPGAELGRSWFWCILITAGQVNFAMSAERFADRRRGGGGAGSATGLTRQVLVGCGLRERRRRPYCVAVIRRPIRRGRDERRSSPGGRRTRGTASRGAGRGRSADEDVDARSVGRLDADASPETGVRASRITKDLSRRRPAAGCGGGAQADLRRVEICRRYWSAAIASGASESRTFVTPDAWRQRQ